MARNSTYSFLDLAGAISHPMRTPFIFTGEGSGRVTVSMLTEKTAHDAAADGSIMVSKIEGNNGQIVIECQQKSLVHKYLLALYNYLLTASAAEWAIAAVVLRNVSDGSSHVCTGVSFGKIPDKSYEAQGARVSWTLWAANIVNTNW